MESPAPVVVAAVASQRAPKQVLSLTAARQQRALVTAEDVPGTVAHAWKHYKLGGYLARRARSTQSGYATAVRLATDPTLMCARPQRGDVDRWLSNLVSVRGLSVASANAYLRYVKAVTSKAQHEVVCQETRELASAFAVVDQLREPVREKRCPAADTYGRAIDACALLPEAGHAPRLEHAPACRALLHLVAAGARPNEVKGLRHSDLDASSMTAHVWRQRGTSAEANAGNDPSRKNGERHLVKLDSAAWVDVAWTAEHYEGLRTRQGYHRGASAGRLFPWGDRVFDGLMRHLRVHLPEAFPEGTGLYALRHLGATTTARLTNGNVEAVQRYLGDRTPGVAMTYCDHVRAETSTDATRLMLELRNAGRQRELLGGSSPAAPVQDGAAGASAPLEDGASASRLEGATPRHEDSNAALIESALAFAPKNAASIGEAARLGFNNNKGVPDGTRS